MTVVRAVMNINPASGTMDYFNVPKAGGKYAQGQKASAEDDQRRRHAAPRES